jgi:RNA polymerase sigma-70 factor (ECF subfamily)
MTMIASTGRGRRACDLRACPAPALRDCADCLLGPASQTMPRPTRGRERSAVLPEAFTRFHDEQRRRFVGYVRSRAVPYDSVEDVVHEAFLRLYRSRQRFLASDNPRAFAFKVLRDTVADYFRAQDRQRSVEEAASGHDRATAAAAEDPIAHLIWQLDVEKALQKLPDRQADCLRLALFLDLPHREIAEYLGIKEGTVGTHLSAGRRRLADHLHGYRAPLATSEEGGTE